MNRVPHNLLCKSDTAKRKTFRATNYFNADHSISEALLEWNDKVLSKTSTFSSRDFMLKRTSDDSPSQSDLTENGKHLFCDMESDITAKTTDRSLMQNMLSRGDPEKGVKDYDSKSGNFNESSNTDRAESYYRPYNGQQPNQGYSNQQPQQQSNQGYSNQQPHQQPNQGYSNQQPQQGTDQQGYYQQGYDQGYYQPDPNQQDPNQQDGKANQPPDNTRSKYPGWETKKSRNRFIFKVFMIVMFLLIYNFLVMCIFIFIPVVKNWAQRYWWLQLVFVLCFLPFAIVLGCCTKIGRKAPLNYVLLFFAATFMGLALGAVSVYNSVDEVLLAVGAVIGIVFILALIAVFAKCDFTMCIGIICAVVLAFSFFGIFMIFFHSRWLSIVYCGIGIIIASILIVINIQMIVGGKNRKYVYSEKDYVPAALFLYIDIAFLLFMVLGLTGAISG